MTFAVPYHPSDFNLPLCVTCGQVFRWQEILPNHWLGGNGDDWYKVSLETNALQVESNRDVESFRRMFRLDDDSIPEEIKQDKLLAEILRKGYGIRTMRSDPIECLFSFLCTSNNHIRRITSMVAHLASFGDKSGEVDGHTVHAFPRCEQIAAIDPQTLRNLGFGYRADYIHRTATELISKGRTWLDDLKEGSLDQARAELMSLPGIGPKLADCICLYGLGFPAVPVDVHLWNVARRHFFPEWANLPLTKSRYDAVGDMFRERYGDAAGYAHQLFFVDELLHWRSRR